MSRLKRLIVESHERSLWQALLVYLGASFAVLEAVDLFIDYLGLPRWLFPVALTLLVIGLPVVAVTSLAKAEEYQDDVPAEAASAAAAEDRRLRLLTWRTAVLALVGAMALWGVVAAALLFLQADDSQLDPDRIVVDVFENRTGDPGLDPLGSMAGHWLVQSLQATGGLRVVPFEASLAVDRRADAAAAADGGRLVALADETGARIVVSGSFYREADQLRFQAEISDAETGELLHAPEPARAPVDSPSVALEPLRVGVRDFLFRHLNPTPIEGRAPEQIEPPRLDAYRQFLVGMDYFGSGDYRSASPYFEQAVQLDSTYPAFIYMAEIALSNQGRYEEAEPYLQKLRRLTDRMTPYERATTDWIEARHRGDLAGKLRAARRMAETGPYYIGYYMLAQYALELNRPAEALETLEENNLEFIAPAWWPYWFVRVGALHSLGQHRRELEAAREAREQHPDVPSIIALELGALAALGDSRTVLERYDELQGLGASALAPLIELGAELHAHGDGESARVVWGRVASWLQAESIPDLTPTQRISLIQVFEHLKRNEEARALVETLATHDSLSYMEHRGILAARRGDEDEAEASLDWLGGRTDEHLDGRHRYAQARITAELGDGERALEFLRRGLAEGRTYPELHRDHYLRSLRDYPPFQELVRPKG
jgi:tetratricopeptide (TPR) repeat protein